MEIISIRDSSVIYTDKSKSMSKTVENAIKKGIDLSYANLSSEEFSDCSFTGGKFNYASFDNSEFNNVIFNKVEAVGATFINTSADDSSFQNSNFKRACFKNSNFNEQKVAGSNFELADFSESSFYNVDFNNCNLINTKFDSINITDSKFENAKLNFDIEQFRKDDFQIFIEENTHVIQEGDIKLTKAIIPNKATVVNEQGKVVGLLYFKDSNYEYWYYLNKNGNEVYHRDNDLPAFIHSNGTKSWYQHGKFHRETGAATSWYDGDLEYYYHGKWLGNSSGGYTKGQFEQYKLKYKMDLNDVASSTDKSTMESNNIQDEKLKLSERDILEQYIKKQPEIFPNYKVSESYKLISPGIYNVDSRIIIDNKEINLWHFKDNSVQVWFYLTEEGNFVYHRENSLPAYTDKYNEDYYFHGKLQKSVKISQSVPSSNDKADRITTPIKDNKSMQATKEINNAKEIFHPNKRAKIAIIYPDGIQGNVLYKYFYNGLFIEDSSRGYSLEDFNKYIDHMETLKKPSKVIDGDQVITTIYGHNNLSKIETYYNNIKYWFDEKYLGDKSSGFKYLGDKSSGFFQQDFEAYVKDYYEKIAKYKKQDEKESDKDETNEESKGLKVKMSFIEQRKQNAIDANWRTQAKNARRLAKAGILRALKSQGSRKSTIEDLSKFFDSQLGEALISALGGLALQHVPFLTDNTKAQRLAKELEINGISEGLDIAMEPLMDMVTEFIMPVVNSLPETKEEKVRVAALPETKKHKTSKEALPSEEEEENEEPAKQLKAVK